MSDKIKVAIVRHNGLFMGGTEKFLQIMAAEVNKDEFEVDFYTTNFMRFKDREQYLKDHNVNIIKFYKPWWGNLPKPWMNKLNHFWLWLKFKKNYYDVVQITNFSWDEYPYNSFYGENVCQFVVFAPFCDFPCVKLSVLNSEWLRQRWIETGGSEEKSVVIPVPTWMPKSTDNMRQELGIDSTTFVCGFHQRKHDDIFSPTQLAAYKLIENDDTYMVVLNGSDLYKEQAKELGIEHISFLDYLKTEEEMSKFFSTLDLYTHGRKDGETYGTIFVEAMAHFVPCISHWTGIQDAMEETIGSGGVVVNNDPKEYAEMIQKIMNMSEYEYNTLCANARLEVVNRFTYKVVVPKIEEAWRHVAGRD
jgi:glycosyltransferase involved in cell wall biosynthesis